MEPGGVMLLDHENTAILASGSGRAGAERLGRALGIALLAVFFQRHRVNGCLVLPSNNIIRFSQGEAPGGLYGGKTDLSRNDLFWTGVHSCAAVHRDQPQVDQLPPAP